MSFRQNPFICLLRATLLLGFSVSAQAQPKSESSDSYELTAYAGFDVMGCVLDEPKIGNSQGLTLHAFVKGNVPFSVVAEDGHGNLLSVSGTVREIDAEDFVVENSKLNSFGLSIEGGIYTSKETKEMRKQLQVFLGPDSHYNPNDPPEAVGAAWCVSVGPGYSISVKRLLNPQQLTIAYVGTNIVLTWPTNVACFVLQSTNATSSVWITNSSTPVIVNGRNAITNGIAGTQEFFRLGH